MSEEWDDLGDDELRSRLIARGCTLDEAGVLVALRDDSDDVRSLISGFLREE